MNYEDLEEFWEKDFPVFFKRDGKPTSGLLKTWDREVATVFVGSERDEIDILIEHLYKTVEEL